MVWGAVEEGAAVADSTDMDVDAAGAGGMGGEKKKKKRKNKNRKPGGVAKLNHPSRDKRP